VVRKGGQKLTAKQAGLADLLRRSPEITRKEIAGELRINEAAVHRRLDVLRQKGVLRRVGPDKGGHWEILG
jgi:ATP-dependent DNA helicase RecG